MENRQLEIVLKVVEVTALIIFGIIGIVISLIQ